MSSPGPSVPAFRALRIVNEDGRVRSSVVRASLDELTPGEVLIRSAYSSVNYKDALAATGAGKILRRFPLIGGIDVSGTIVSSDHPDWHPGDRVLVTGYDLGVAADGGYAEYVRVPAAWLVRVPDDLGLFEVMAYGTAGFTAALAIVRLERNGLVPGSGPVVVTGATGGVGSIAVAALSGLGHAVTAITGKHDAHEYLRRLGAQEVLARSSIDMGTRPLEKATWAGAVDAVGGDMLAWLTRTMRPWGCIASAGLAGGIELRTTVMPFILRGVSLLGIDSVTCPMALRQEVWRRLTTDLRVARVDEIAREIGLDELHEAFSTLLAGEARGRFVVRLGGEDRPG